MIKKGDIVIGNVTNIIGYGAFVSVDEYDGLIHISEFSDNFVRSIDDFVHIGQKVKLKVIEVEEEQKRLKLSYKALHKNRGIKKSVPKYKVGFDSLKGALDSFIKEQISEEEK